MYERSCGFKRQSGCDISLDYEGGQGNGKVVCLCMEVHKEGTLSEYGHRGGGESEVYDVSESVVYNMDCMEYMKTLPDKAFDLAIVDPPYGIKRLERKEGRLEKYGDSAIANNAVPTSEYFDELFRVSKNQIVWGGNYFNLPPCRCFIVWYKHQPIENYSDCEFAWTSFDRPAKVFDYQYFGNVNQDLQRIHPTQKPVALYEWLLTRFARERERVLDTHVGSGSSRIACAELGFDFVGCEIDKGFWEKEEKRFKEYSDQLTLF